MDTSNERVFGCTCGHEWSLPFGVARPEVCPSCGGANLHRKSESGSFGGGRGGNGKCRGLRTGLQREGNGQGQGAERGQCGAEEGSHQHKHQNSTNL